MTVNFSCMLLLVLISCIVCETGEDDEHTDGVIENATRVEHVQRQMGKMAEKRIQGEESKYGEALSKNKHLSSQHSLVKLNNKISPPNTSDDGDRGTDQKCSDVNIWFVPNNGTCECGSDLNEIVLCDPVTKDLAIMDCYCITYQYSSEGEPMFPVVGGCVFNCVNHTRSGYANIYHSAPSDCASLNRQGTLCGQCLDGYTVPAYSYEFKCIRCDRELENWGLYIVFAFLPLTLFIVIILVFRINVLSPKLYMYVYAAQCLSIPAQVKVILYYLSQKKSPALHTVPAAMVLSNYGIWNLDFVRVNVLPDVCIDVIPLHILVLDYLIAIYPMLLMAALYAMVELYGFEFRPLRCMWKPFHYFFARFRRHWGIQTTIMDAFVTFFFLSTTKLLSVSCDLLISTKVYTREGKPYSRNLFYDPSITYFGKEHLPYALMALAILTVFIAFPTSLLLCYQCKVYRKCLTKCQIHGNIVETFVESFQKYYKDGSNGTWDCRWFAGFWVLFKCFCYLIYSISLTDISLVFLTVTAIIGATIVVIVQPYREEYSAFNVISANLFLWQALVCAFMSRESLSAIVAAEFKDHFFCVFFLWLVPLTYIIGIPLHKLVVKLRQWQLEKASSLTSSLPHRLVHSDQYRHPPS